MTTNNMNEQAGKVAFITGGNRGIGLETARQLGKLGVQVIIGARDGESGKKAAETLRAEGVQADHVKFDVTLPADHQTAYNYFEQRYGKLDILINNAGVQLETDHIVPMNNTSDVSPAVLRDTFEANFFKLIALTQHLLPLIRKSPSGRIVNLSSVLGSLNLMSDQSSPVYGVKLLAYNASKAALNMFTIHLAHELKETPIKVNSAHPGWVKTPLGGQHADMEVGDGAKTSVMLATLPADGPTGKFYHSEAELPW